MASYDELRKIVVNVEVYNKKHAMFDCEGAGVFVSPDRHVLTMSHMFKHDSNAGVRIRDKDDVPFDCTIVDVSPNLGLALIKVDKNEKFSCGTIDEGELVNGEEIYAFGLPHFLDYSYPIGEISCPCRSYGEVLDYIKEAQYFKRNDVTYVDPSNKVVDPSNKVVDPSNKVVNYVDHSAMYVNYVDNLDDLKLERSVSLIQLNNVHGDGMGGSSGMPLFNSLGNIIGMYAFTAHDKCYAIHARCIRSYLKQELGDVSGHGEASTSGI